MKNSRREFLTKLGATVGAITIGRNIMEALPSTDFQKESIPKKTESGITIDVADFRYAPRDWQTTYCFPDDPFKSLVGKNGDLRYGHEGIGKDEKYFPHVISVGLKDREPLKYVEQKLESPSIPIITTLLAGDELNVKLVSFATRTKDEGRVDNMIIEVTPKSEQDVEFNLELQIKSKSKFVISQKKDFSIVHFDAPDKKVFIAVNSLAEFNSDEEMSRLQLKTAVAKLNKPLKYFVRIPQEGQDFDKIKDGFDDKDDLLKETRKFWESWKPIEGKINWQIEEPYRAFQIASARNIVEAREIKNGKKIFQVGPTVYRGLWIVDGHFLLEAARYLGYDKEAQEGLETIWDMQDEKGFFKAGAGEAHWKDTAVAVFSLIRQAELSQDWTYFNELYPDAFKAMMALRELKNNALNDGTLNGKYKLLPRGYGDSGIGGIREEYTNTLWTLIALKSLKETAWRLKLQKAVELRDFFGELWFAFTDSTKLEMKKHPKGFDYLPMLMQSDPKWKESDERKQPRPQAAQIYLSHAIFPGVLFKRDNKIVNGHLKLMEVVVKEDIPIETGWLTDNAVWPYNAAILAQVYLWMKQPELARKTFYGFLNHASPLYAWREEQSLKDAIEFQYIGDMPHNWASAECIRYLRHMMILEDEKNLLLLYGLGLQEMEAQKPMALTYSPTRWGRVSVSIEPVDSKTWITKFKREDFDEKTYAPIEYIVMPAKIGGKIAFSGATGAKAVRNGDDIIIRAENLQWECKWKKIYN
jgi:hypothetical protein